MKDEVLNRHGKRWSAIDLRFQGQSSVIHAFLMIREDGSAALVECGPASTRAALLAGLEASGVAPERVTDLFLTHIHLDHGGDAGWWAEQGTTVHVHPSAVRHLVDPSRLVAGARALYGDRFDTLWGEVRPVDEARLRAVDDGAPAGGDGLRGWHSPGHARHHVAWEWDGELFTGDVAGARVPGRDHVSVTAAPPQFDPEAYDDTLARLSGRPLRRLWLTHGGPFDDVTAHWQRYRHKVAETFDRVRRWVDDGLDDEQVREAYHVHERDQALAAGLTEDDWNQLEWMNPARLSADGMLLYLRR